MINIAPVIYVMMLIKLGMSRYTNITIQYISRYNRHNAIRITNHFFLIKDTNSSMKNLIIIIWNKKKFRNIFAIQLYFVSKELLFHETLKVMLRLQFINTLLNGTYCIVTNVSRYINVWWRTSLEDTKHTLINSKLIFSAFDWNLKKNRKKKYKVLI